MSVDIEKIKAEARKELLAEQMDDAKEIVKDKLRELEDARLIVRNLERELEEIYLEITA